MKQRLLILDDDATFRERLALSLRNRGHQISTAASGDIAADLIRKYAFDAAIIDLRLEGETGLEIMEQLRRIRSDLRVVILTGYGSIATAKQALRMGAVDYLTKPVDPAQIEAVLNSTENDLMEIAPARVSVPSLQRVEWEHMQQILADTGGNISETARRLGMERRSLQRKLAKLPPPESG